MGVAQAPKLTRLIWLIIVPVALLVVAGLLAIYATERQAESGGAPNTIRQLVYVVASLIALAATLAVPYQKIGRYAFILFGLMLLLLCVLAAVRVLHVSIPMIPVVRGSARWIRFGTSTIHFQLQPSEFMKVAFILALAWYLRYRDNYRTLLGLMPPFLLTLLPMGLILMQPDLGTVLLMLPVLFAMLLMAGARISHMLLIVLMSTLAAPFAWGVMKHYQRDRVLVLVGQLAPSRDKLLPKSPDVKSATTMHRSKGPLPMIRLTRSERLALAMLAPNFRQAQLSGKKRRKREQSRKEPGLIGVDEVLAPPEISTKTLLFFKGRFHDDPEQDLLIRKWLVGKLNDLHNHEGYQLHHSKVALGSGGLFGQGPWQGTYVRYSFLPDRHNDFIYAILGHQWGLAGCMIVIMLYVLIVIGGVEVATATDDPFGRLLVVGVIALMTAQVFVNVGMTVGLMPITGMTLPFVSFGGSSLITNFIAVGLLLNVSRYRPLLIANRPFEFDDEPDEQPASLARWIETRR